MEIEYRDVLKAIKGKKVELRHDVDLSLISAYNMALIEKDMGVKSIYYIRFDCDYYNPFSVNSAKLLNLIEKMGHEIGLHVESSVTVDELSLNTYLDYYNMLYSFKKFTFHINSDRTQKFIKKKYGKFNNKSLVGKYISDSRGEFDQTKLDWIKENNDYTLLIHPEWWMHKGTKKQIISKAIKEILP